jgi:hypothetical protein
VLLNQPQEVPMTSSSTSGRPKPKTIHFPFGYDNKNGTGCNTLILCVNEQHARRLMDAFEIVAEYQWGMPNIGGNQYTRIVIHLDIARGLSATEQDRFTRYWNECILTTLVPKGKIVYI